MLLAKINDHNVNTADTMRRFDVRVGINSNVDNLIKDINNRENLAGAGINIARRVMDAADANQIMPPKSTWFEPKLRDGLLIHVI